MLFINYPKCSTCRKAKAWLDEHKLSYTDRHIKDDPPDYDELKNWHIQSGIPLKKFFNTSGQLYRMLGLKDKLPSMTDDEMLSLLSTDGMLVKRPILVSGEKLLIGFKPEQWEEALIE